MKKHIIVSGDRPTGPLHIGHYIGSLQNRVKLQEEGHTLYIMLADVQALTDNAQNPEKIRENIVQVALDYLAIGINPAKSTIFIQSMIPALPELTIYFLNLVTINRLSRNPTVKTEIQQKKFGESIPAGFFMYPVSQAADIAGFKADLVPVGEDQLPMIEQTNEIVRSFNRFYGPVLVEAKPMIPPMARLPGTDGQAKMSKSLNNAIFLSDSSDQVAKKVRSMYTDPGHVRVADPGKVEGNPVFAYLDVFDPDKTAVTQLKEHYQRGGLADTIVKGRLLEVLEAFLTPIRLRRQEYAANMDYVIDVILQGSHHAATVADTTLQQAKQAMKLDYHRMKK